MSNFLWIFPIPAPFKPRSRIYDLKSRLDWGEPALTIIDVSNRESFNYCHIRGAIHLPMDSLAAQARLSLELSRDIYVYGETDDETAIAAQALRAAGFQNVAEIIGGLGAWKAVGFPVESTTAIAVSYKV